MSEPIIIETPAPPTRERLVLVPPSSVSNPIETTNGVIFTVRTGDARDATPDDLARGGYVPVERAEKAEWSARVARMALANEHQDREGVRIRKDLGTQDAPCPCDTDPEQGMGMHSPPCPLHEAARALRRKTSWRDAALTLDGELKNAITRAEKAERERDEEKRHAGDAADALARLMRERDTLRAEVARLTAPGEGSEGEPTDWLGMWNGFTLDQVEDSLYGRIKRVWRAGVAHERARQQPTKDRATKCVVVRTMRKAAEHFGRGDGTFNAAGFSNALYEILGMRGGLDGHIVRAILDGRADCEVLSGGSHFRIVERAEKDRATDEELVDLYRKVYETHGGGTISVSHDDCRRAGISAAAARVRQERCLVAQAVGMGADLYVTAHGVAYRVTVAKGRHMQRAYPDAVDVPSTLARLLGEVGRG